jgi:ankyrin repeat protein
MVASWNGHHDIVRTLLEAKADINAMTNVRNQMMMIILLTIFLMLMMMMMMMMMMIVINDEDRDVCR